jgi:hypothetical protein
MNPQLRAEEIASEFGRCLEHEVDNVWVTAEAFHDQTEADEAADRFTRAGFSARVTPTPCSVSCWDVWVDMTEAMAEHRRSLSSPGNPRFAP